VAEPLRFLSGLFSFHPACFALSVAVTRFPFLFRAVCCALFVQSSGIAQPPAAGGWPQARQLLTAFCRLLWLNSSKQVAAFTHAGSSIFYQGK
jgi:hypothetical protein